MLVKNAAEAGNGADSDVSVCRCVIKDDSITVLRTLGIGEFGVVQHAVWAKDTAHQVCLTASMSVSLSHCICLSVSLPNNQLFHYYSTVIWPVLEYYVPVWHCALTKAQIEQIETSG